MRDFSIFRDVRSDTEDFPYKVRRRLLRASSQVVSAWMTLLSLIGKKSLVGEDSMPVVTLTTYGDRAQTVASTIESIGRGRFRPSRLILWLDDPSILHSLPRGLRRQQARGLEIYLTENVGPHTKYYPFVANSENDDRPFVTADDDILYPQDWLRGLVRAAQQDPEHVICYRAHRILVREGRVLPYDQWESVQDSHAALTVFATGVSGVIYPARMIEALQHEGQKFMETAPHADDIWLHHVALRYDIPVRQVCAVPRHFWMTPGSQAKALMTTNLTGGNDLVISRLYSDNDVNRLGQSE